MDSRLFVVCEPATTTQCEDMAKMDRVKESLTLNGGVCVIVHHLLLVVRNYLFQLVEIIPP